MVVFPHIILFPCVPRCGAICASQQLRMGKRRTTSRAVVDLAPMARAPVQACAARSDGRNDDSVLLSRHRRLISEPLMWGNGFNERGISQTTQPDQLEINRGTSLAPCCTSKLCH